MTPNRGMSSPRPSIVAPAAPNQGEKDSEDESAGSPGGGARARPSGNDAVGGDGKRGPEAGEAIMVEKKAKATPGKWRMANPEGCGLYYGAREGAGAGAVFVVMRLD